MIAGGLSCGPLVPEALMLNCLHFLRRQSHYPRIVRVFSNPPSSDFIFSVPHVSWVFQHYVQQSGGGGQS